jgi:hypothetical protein
VIPIDCADVIPCKEDSSWTNQITIVEATAPNKVVGSAVHFLLPVQAAFECIDDARRSIEQANRLYEPYLHSSSASTSQISNCHSAVISGQANLPSDTTLYQRRVHNKSILWDRIGYSKRSPLQEEYGPEYWFRVVST